MKHENRLSLFLTDSYGKIIDFQKIKEELGCTLVRGKAYNSASWPFSKFPEKNLKRVLEDKMKEPFTDLIIQLSANDISNLQIFDDQDLKLKMAAKSTKKIGECCLGKGAKNQNGNLRWHLPLGVRPHPPPSMAKFPDIFSPHFFSFATESYIYETDFTLQKYHF